MTDSKPIKLYTVGTPNGIKVSILLELLGLPYIHQKITFSKMEQKEPWFLEINPNGRIPAITDENGPDGKPIHVFESGAILQYLVDTYDKDHKFSYPHGSREYWETSQWLFFQNAGVGPMQGQLNHFKHYAPEEIPYGVTRYLNETKRLYSVLDKRIGEQEGKGGWLVGDRITIADVTNFGWVNSARYAGIDLDRFPNLKSWWLRLRANEKVLDGIDIPDPKPRDQDKLREIEERDKKEGLKWVQEGMKQDADEFNKKQ